MGLRRRIAHALAPDLIAEVTDEARAKLAEATGLVDADENQWRLLTGEAQRDLPSISHDRSIEVAFSLYQQNPLAHRIVELNRDFIVGDGLTVSASNPDVEELVSEFWHDEVNQLDMRLGDFCLEQGIFGELAPEAFVSDVAGVVQLGYIDPAQIRSVKPLDENPLVRDLLTVRSKKAAVQGKVLDIIRQREAGGPLAGEVFYFPINGLSNSTRGWSDLLHVADWLDIYDQMLWEALERQRLMRAFIWDVTLKGMDQGQIDAWLRKNGSAPRGGTVRGHNEEVEWNAVSPDLGSADLEKDADTILQHIAAGAGLPKTWLSSADDVNRASAQMMDTPTVKRLSRRQDRFLYDVRFMLRFVLDSAIESGRLSVDADGMVPIFVGGVETGEKAIPIETVALSGPEIAARDLPSMGALLMNLSSALALGEAQGWFGADTSRQAVAQVLAQLGVDFDPAAEPEEVAPTDEVPSDVQEAIRAVGA